MSDLVLITPPVLEPVTLSELKLQMGFSPMEDSDHVKSEMLATQLRKFIRTARVECENHTRRAFITQTWKYLRDGFSYDDHHYAHSAYPSIYLPKPPFQSIVRFQYVDSTGVLLDLPQDTTYGNTPPQGQYAYQLDPGSLTQPSRISPAWVTPWPPLRAVQSNVLIEFVAGYGDTPDTVPEPIRTAVLFQAQYYYDNGINDYPMPRVVRSLLEPYRNFIA